ncbi:MAG: hypothetical protein Q9165_006345, partial [Trypethelium subeluteriae]
MEYSTSSFEKKFEKEHPSPDDREDKTVHRETEKAQHTPKDSVQENMGFKEGIKKLEPNGEVAEVIQETTGTSVSAAKSKNSTQKVHKKSTRKILSTKCPECEAEIQVQFRVNLQHNQSSSTTAELNVPVDLGEAHAVDDAGASVRTTTESLDGKSRLGFALSDDYHNQELVEESEWQKLGERGPSQTRHGSYALLIAKFRSSPYPYGPNIMDEELTLLSPGLLDLFRRVVPTYPSINMESTKITIQKPYEPLFFYFNEICDLAKRQPEVAGSDLDCFVYAYDRYIRTDHQAIRELALKNVIEHASLWAIFKPGDCIYSLDESNLPSLRILATIEYRYEDHISPRGISRFCANMWSIGWDATDERVVVDESPNVNSPRRIPVRYAPQEGIPSTDIERRPIMGETARSRAKTAEPPIMPVGFSDEYSNFDDFDPRADFNDIQAQLCPSTVRCYGLKSSKIFRAEVTRLAGVKWETDSINHLELDKAKKATVCSLVGRHKKNSDHIIRDVIPGKGKGLVIVLHGPPGVGKTLTAETVAEFTQKPLLPINIGELTGNVDVVECLNQVFFLAARWDAIVLLDEADVLLEKRSYEDLSRNGLVSNASVFLRMLEYFEGIMFMTSNRIETIDLAFQSRIHIAIKYDTLTPEKRRRIWERFIDRLDEREEEAKSELRDKLDDIQEWELNGRQIRNVLSIAESIALNAQRRRGALRYHHVETIANQTLDFQDFFEVSHEKRKNQVAEIGARRFQERK